MLNAFPLNDLLLTVLAGKVEDDHLKLRDVINIVHAVIHRYEAQSVSVHHEFFMKANDIRGSCHFTCYEIQFLLIHNIC